MHALKIQLLLTGNELMSGDVIDSNSAMIAQQLKEIGIEVKRKVTVSDDLEMLIEEIKQMTHQADILILNGGLGPTVDDLTAQALADAAQLPLIEHPEALQHLTQWCKSRKADLSPQNLKQTILPTGCEIIANEIGSAVGFKLVLNQCEILCTPGVPSELKLMLSQQIVPFLQAKMPKTLHTHVTRLQVFGIGESTLQRLIDEKFPDWPCEIELGFRATSPLLEVKLTTRTLVDQENKSRWLEKIKALLGDHIFNFVEERPITLAEAVIKELTKRSYKISVAESCTGGLIASQLTKTSGVSSVFEAGFVTYSNSMKTKMLSVDENTLQVHGAVSEACVIEMAQNALVESKADVAIAVSGIAGPDGGTTDKPVGTVWIAWGNKATMHAICLNVPGQRVYFQRTVATVALDLMRRLLIGSDEKPFYFAKQIKR